jgi:hypothetical protein
VSLTESFDHYRTLCDVFIAPLLKVILLFTASTATIVIQSE